MTRNIVCINGPNLNLLGQREPEIYGRETLADIENRLQATAEALNITLDFRQTNSEGEMVTWIQEAGSASNGIILNAAAYTHTSVAIHDALKAISIPIVEVHLSNPYARETFRHTNFISPVATGSIAGLGSNGYVLALNALSELIPSN